QAMLRVAAVAALRCGLPRSGRFIRFDAFIEPAFRIVRFLLRIPPREDSVEILTILEVLRNNHARICVVHNVLAKEQLALEYVANQCAQEKNVRACPKRYPDIRNRRRSAEAWVH